MKKLRLLAESATMWLVKKNSFSKFTHQAEFFDQSHVCTLSFRFLHNGPISSKNFHKVVNRQKFLNLFSVPAVLPCNIGAGNSNSDANLVLTIKAPISVTWFNFSYRCTTSRAGRRNQCAKYSTAHQFLSLKGWEVLLTKFLIGFASPDHRGATRVEA